MDPLAGALVALAIVVLVVIAASQWAVHHRGKRPRAVPYPPEPRRGGDAEGGPASPTGAPTRVDESRT